MGRTFIHATLSMITLLALLAPLAMAADSAPATAPARQLAAMPPTDRWMSIVGCITSGLRYHKSAATDAMIYGGTGFAFALNVGDKLDIAGPTDWDYHPCFTLAQNMGLNIVDVGLEGGAGRARDVQDTWMKITAGIDQGVPAFAWAMNVPEYYVIYGYDNQGNYLFRDFGGATKKLACQKLCDRWPLIACTMAKAPAADEAKIINAALQLALDVASGKHSKGNYRAGAAGYDTWIKALTDNTASPEGNAYNAQVWSECRQAASDFFREAAWHTTDQDDLKALYEDAAQNYSTVAIELKAVAKLFPFKADNPDMMKQNQADAGRRKEAAKHLETARDAETRGLAVIEQILAR